MATLIALARTHPGAVTAAWFDHAMRPQIEVSLEGAVVRRVARDLGIPMVEGRARTTPHGEAAARTARYRWLARAASKAGVSAVATGHTRDDQAETLLLRLVRGTGARGAAGMAAVAPWPVTASSAAVLRLVRPLLAVSRVEVEAYLEALEVEAAHDPSNDSDEYARNRMRHAVLPVLAEVNPEASAHLAAFADREREDDEALTLWARRWLDEHEVATRSSVGVPRKALAALPLAVERRVLGEAAARLGIRLGEAHIEALGRLTRGPGGANLTLAGASAEVRGTVLRLRRA